MTVQMHIWPKSRYTHLGLRGAAVTRRNSGACSESVEIPDTEKPAWICIRTSCSGGMRQRVMIAMALTCDLRNSDCR